jgi:flagellar basal-body rod modification protein FlgD
MYITNQAKDHARAYLNRICIAGKPGSCGVGLGCPAAVVRFGIILALLLLTGEATMTTSTVGGVTGATSSSSSNSSTSANTVDAFRNADFLQIMMTEITNQDPLNPSDTSKLVDDVQKLQDLANSTYQKYRSDITWAQQLMGQTVSVQQQALSPADAQAQKDSGLNPDVGFATVTGKVTSFRNVNQTIYVTVGGKDYPMDNIQQVVPDAQNAQYLSQMANELLGKQVAYVDSTGTQTSGQVNSVKYDSSNNLVLQVGTASVPFNQITQIGVSSGSTTGG